MERPALSRDYKAPEEIPDIGQSLMTPQSQAEQEVASEKPPQAIIESPLIGATTSESLNQSTDSLSAIRQQLHRSTVPEFLLHLPTMLVEYYFTYVCRIFSSFDGTLNPFRSTVGRLWDGSAPIYYAIQSMAAAYLANHFPRMTSVGIQMQRETYKCLYQGENLDKTLLTVLLVGQTTAWHDPRDLGLVHLRTAKRLNRRRLEGQGVGVEARERRQNEFFEQCIMYWDMLAGFVDDDVGELEVSQIPSPSITSVGEGSPLSSTPSSEKEKVFPHPWTGVAPQAQNLFAQVGRLIRRHRKTTSQDLQSLDFFSLDFAFSTAIPTPGASALESAQSLEEAFLSFTPPSASSLVDAGDENTPVGHYIILADAYRCAGLLSLYRVFPALLSRRVPLPFAPASELNPFTFVSTNISLPLEDFLLSLALHTISLLSQLPLSSGTRCLQPILFLVAGSELRFDPTLSPSIFNSIKSREVEIATARSFVTSRLQDFCSSLPAKPVKKALVIVEEMWARGDAGGEWFWMDVMGEMGWETIFG